VSSKVKPLTAAQLRAHESKRDLAGDLLESVKQMKSGKTAAVHTPAVEARERTGLSQSQFAALLGVSVRTLQGWEQGRKQPSGAARTLLTIARTNPKALLAVAGRHWACGITRQSTRTYECIRVRRTLFLCAGHFYVSPLPR
jgi:putative transcriptional regulator